MEVASEVGAKEVPYNALSHGRPAWLAKFDDDSAYDWARIAWDRAWTVDDAWFDAAKADAIVALWPTIFTLTKDRFNGLPFILNGWQEIIVRLLVGFKVPIDLLDALTHAPIIQHVRLFRRLLLWVPRKNGKSEFLAALGLLFWAVEGLHGGEAYTFARDEDQGRIVLDRMKAMVANSPALRKEIRVYKDSLWLPSCQAKVELLPGVPDGKHGRMASVNIGDEMHEWKTRALENALRQSTGTRLQPIELYGSTTGHKNNKVGVEIYDESVSILDGRRDDPSTLVVIYAAPADADYLDEAVWRRANPSLGLSPTLDFMRREARQAKDNPRKEAEFRCYHLNQWIEQHVRWLNLRKWDACARDKNAWRDRWETLKGRRCYAGADLSSTKDVTALELLFPPYDGVDYYQVISLFWVPEDTLRERVVNDKVDYDKWLAAGALQTTPGDFVDQNFLKRAILDAGVQFDLQMLGFDQWNATKLVSDLQADGMDPALFLKVRQGVQSLGEPTKQLEKLVYAGKVDHGGHPVLRWMAGNAVVRFDENLNYMPAKKKSPEKIDGISALVNAIAAEMSGMEVGKSFWESAAA